jgi:hypothetical protein
MTKLATVLEQYSIDLVTDAGVDSEAPLPIDSFLVLSALEDMIGVSCGGHFLEEELVKWLTTPAQERRPCTLADLQERYDTMDAEITKMVESDLAEDRIGQTVKH